MWSAPHRLSLSPHVKFLHNRVMSSSISHRNRLSIRLSTARRRGSSRTRTCRAGRWRRCVDDRTTERERGGSRCPAGWFSICREEMAHLENDLLSSNTFKMWECDSCWPVCYMTVSLCIESKRIRLVSDLPLRSSAHSSHGKNLEKRFTNCPISCCWVVDGLSG